MVTIFAYNSNLLLEKRNLSISEYYDGENPLIDDNEYRKKNGINKIKGIIYNDGSSDILEQFVNYFDSDGRLVGSNGYDANFILTDTFQIFYDYNQYIGYCEINITLQDHKLNMDISLEPQKLLRFVLNKKLMRFHNGDYELADEFITTQISDKFFISCSTFDTRSDEKYRVDVEVRFYDGNVLLGKSTIVSEVLSD